MQTLQIFLLSETFHLHFEHLFTKIQDSKKKIRYKANHTDFQMRRAEKPVAMFLYEDQKIDNTELRKVGRQICYFQLLAPTI